MPRLRRERSRAGPTDLDLEEQDMRSAWYSRAQVERMIHDGTMTDSKSIAAYALLLLGDRRHS